LEPAILLLLLLALPKLQVRASHMEALPKAEMVWGEKLKDLAWVKRVLSDEESLALVALASVSASVSVSA